jgi:hypothetical protein
MGGRPMIALIIEHISEYAVVYAYIFSGGCMIATGHLCSSKKDKS